MTENSKAVSSPAPNQGPNTSTRTENTKSTRPRHGKPKKVQATPRTPEEQKLYLENQKKALEAAQARASQVQAWETLLPKMDNRQIQGELKRVIRGKFLGEPASLLGIAEAICQSISLKNIKTRDNLAGQLSAVINPTISAGSPRYQV